MGYYENDTVILYKYIGLSIPFMGYMKKKLGYTFLVIYAVSHKGNWKCYIFMWKIFGFEKYPIKGIESSIK